MDFIKSVPITPEYFQLFSEMLYVKNAPAGAGAFCSILFNIPRDFSDTGT